MINLKNEEEGKKAESSFSSTTSSDSLRLCGGGGCLLSRCFFGLVCFFRGCSRSRRSVSGRG